MMLPKLALSSRKLPSASIFSRMFAPFAKSFMSESTSKKCDCAAFAGASFIN